MAELKKLRRLNVIASPIIALSIECSPLFANRAATNCFNSEGIPDIATFIEGRLLKQIKSMCDSGKPTIVSSDKFVSGMRTAVALFFDFEDTRCILLTFVSTLRLIPDMTITISPDIFADIYSKKLNPVLSSLIEDDSGSINENAIRRLNVCEKLSTDSAKFFSRINMRHIRSDKDIKMFVSQINGYIDKILRKYSFIFDFSYDEISENRNGDKAFDHINYLLNFSTIVLTLLGFSSNKRLGITVNTSDCDDGFYTVFDTDVSCDMPENAENYDIVSLCHAFPTNIPNLICIDTAREFFGYREVIKFTNRGGSTHLTLNMYTECVVTDIIIVNMQDYAYNCELNIILSVLDDIFEEMDG